MPIYEFACPKCRVVFNFLSRRVNPDRKPACPKCGNKKLTRLMSRFAMTKGMADPSSPESMSDPDNMPDPEDPKILRAMSELERDMAHIDENNPRHMGQVMRKLKDVMPPGVLPREMDVAIKRLEAGEDPEKIEEDMGDVLGALAGGEGGPGGPGGFAHDPGLYDY